MLDRYEGTLSIALVRPVATVIGITGLFVFSLALYPLIGKAYFPRTDPSQFVVSVKAPSGTRLELTEKFISRVEDIVRSIVPERELKIIVSNIGTTPGFNSILNPNSCPSTATVQVGLNEGHRLSSFAYMGLVRERIRHELPELSAYLQTGGLVDAILNQGIPAPLDIQVSSMDLKGAHDIASQIARQVRALPGVSDVLIPQDVDYPALKIDIDRERASELGLSAQEVTDSLITALTSNGMIAPSYWIDPKNGNNYLLTVQYPEGYVKNLADLGSMPLRAAHLKQPTRLDSVVRISRVPSPTEVDHYQIRRAVDVYVAPTGEDLSKLYAGVEKIVAQDEAAAEHGHQRAGHGAGHALFVPQLRPGADSRDVAGLSDPGGATQIVRGPVPDSAGGADRGDRRAAHSVCHRHHHEHHVLDGSGDDGGHRGVE